MSEPFASIATSAPRRVDNVPEPSRGAFAAVPADEVAMPIDEQTYKDIMARHPSGVTVVTAWDDEGVGHGLTVSAFSTVSLDPPSVLVVIDKRSHTLPVLLHGGAFTVSLLASGAEDVALHFATKEDDKFASLPAHDVRRVASGPALVAWSTAYLSCTTTHRVEAGDHWVLIGRVDEAELLDADEPLVYSHRRFRRLAAG